MIQTLVQVLYCSWYVVLPALLTILCYVGIINREEVYKKHEEQSLKDDEHIAWQCFCRFVAVVFQITLLWLGGFFN